MFLKLFFSYGKEDSVDFTLTNPIEHFKELLALKSQVEDLRKQKVLLQGPIRSSDSRETEYRIESLNKDRQIQTLTQKNSKNAQEIKNLTEEKIRNTQKFNQILTFGLFSVLAFPPLYALFFEVIPFVGLQGTNIAIQKMCSNGENRYENLPKFEPTIHNALYTGCISRTSTLLPKEITNENFIIEDKGWGYANLIVLDEEGKPKQQVALNFSNATGKEILTFLEINNIPSNTVSITTPPLPIILNPQTPIAHAAKVLRR